MEQDAKKCQGCGSTLVFVNSSPPKWHRTFLARFSRAVVVVFASSAFLGLFIPEFNIHYRDAFLIIGLLIAAVLVQIPVFKRSKVVNLYKCEKCSRYSAFEEVVGS